jgi:hypothetical protein
VNYGQLAGVLPPVDLAQLCRRRRVIRSGCDARESGCVRLRRKVEETIGASSSSPRRSVRGPYLVTKIEPAFVSVSAIDSR